MSHKKETDTRLADAYRFRRQHTPVFEKSLFGLHWVDIYGQ